MAVCPQPLPLTPPSQIGHKLGRQSNINYDCALICQLPVTFIRSARKSICGPLESPKCGGAFLPTDTMPRPRLDRVALVAHRVVSATRQSYRVAARLARWNGVSVARCLWRYGPPRSHDPLKVGAPCRRPNPVCRDSGSPTIHQHLAPLPQCRDGTKGNSCQPFVVVLNSLFPVKIVIDPGAGGVWGMRRVQRLGRSHRGISVSHLGGNKATVWVCCRSASRRVR